MTSDFIVYQTDASFPGWAEMPAMIENFIKLNNIKSVFEIGAGANPTLPPDRIKALNISYTINDIDLKELEKADIIYERDVTDLCKESINIQSRYGLVFSRMAGEHFYNARNLHKNVLKILAPGGYALHCFSTLYALPFLVNKLVPESVSQKLLSFFNPRDLYQHDKFEAYYDMSYGPSKKMVNFFISTGYDIVNYTGYFGHGYYKKIPVLRTLEKLKANWLVKHPIPELTSYSMIVLRKKSQ
ncbi:MAG TPA: hypothetical protein VNI52_06110 [Sphingobacteriaceae bacterium]|nr:hypothetical protein [Sphingobacteriaceae bacterium]